MPQIIIIGGGIVGTTAAYYLSKTDDQVTLIDNGLGNASRAAAGIICPWLSQRRNQKWYQLTSQGAAFYPQLMADLQADGEKNLPYRQTGTLVFKNKPQLLEKLEKIAQKRRQNAPMMGDLILYSSQQLQALVPSLETNQGAVYTSGGGRLDGAALVDRLLSLFQKNGGRYLQGKAQLLDSQTVQIGSRLLKADQLILAAGAWLPELLSPLGYQTDIRPQKGQLLEIQTAQMTDNWPGLMLHGEIDILPFDDGKLVIGATHEDDQGYDLSLDAEKIAAMQATASLFIPQLTKLPISKTRVGTRAYTSDYSPFYGHLKEVPHIYVASGLGSSGLTSGPFIGWQLAQLIQNKDFDFDTRPYKPDPYVVERA